MCISSIDKFLCIFLLSSIHLKYPQYFPRRKNDQFQLKEGGTFSLALDKSHVMNNFLKQFLFACIEKIVIPYGSEELVGPWRVKSELLSKEEGPINHSTLQKKRAVQDFESLMKGQICYFLEVLESRDGKQPSLVFVEKFTKKTRPPCWKNVDLKIESTLPLLGIDTTFIHDNPALCHPRLAKVSITLDHK